MSATTEVEAAGRPAQRADHPPPRGLGGLLRRPTVAVLLVTAVAAVLRFVGLGQPSDFVFDEVYYPTSGCILIGGSNEMCRIDESGEEYWLERKWDVGSWVHPPLGKWQIGLGIKAFGMDPFGWRVTSALAGTLVVAGAAVLTWLLLGSAIWVYVAGLLLATEHLNVVMSRTALLDVHLELWVVAAFLCLVLDRRWVQRRQPPDPAPTPEHPDPGPARIFSPVWRPWRFASGFAFGAALSVKWSGAMALAGGVLIAYVWETTRRHRAGRSWPSALGRALARESFGIVLAFLIVPAAVFVVTWLPWIHHFDQDWGFWWRTQVEAWEFQSKGLAEFKEDPQTGAFTPTHPDYSRPWQWLLLWHPTSFWTKDIGASIRQIVALGNPAIFWASLVAIPALAIAWRRLRDWRAGFVLVAIASQYLPWLVVNRPTFAFYVLPMTPFMIIGITYLLRWASDATLVVREPGGEVAADPETGEPAISTAYPYRPFVWAYLIVAAALAWWFWPVAVGAQISDLRWHTIVWFVNWM